ncbi:GGDEF domain-containing protein [Carnobacterium divergens]|uniref:GGDEF domain-containing protein n=1 Tax=Carnobacterium divergens TaxID=2748 RepID=UPI00288D75FE|nr:GGDEF domain-containing protein [Carnobacterium divergens]MDT2011409.1 GGDEF domain-containing protein [Carnobacterium divergens]
MQTSELLIRSLENISVIYFFISVIFYLFDGKEIITVYSAYWKKALFGISFGLLALLLTETAIKQGTSELSYSLIPIFICFYLAGPFAGLTSFFVLSVVDRIDFSFFNVTYMFVIFMFLIILRVWDRRSVKAFSIVLLILIVYSLVLIFIFYPNAIWKPTIWIFELFCYFSSVICYFFINKQRIYFQSHLILVDESRKDFLTELFNRNYLIKLTKQKDAKNKLYSILLLDIDHFKKINDQYGHAAGDTTLMQFAALVMRKLPPNSLVFRYGGEEFIILTDETDREKVKLLAEDIRLAVESYPFILSETKKIAVTTSIGVSFKVKETQCYQEIINQADEALYRGKAQNRNQVVLF